MVDPTDGLEPVRLWQVALEGSVAPGDEVLLCHGDRDPFALVGEWAGGRAVVGSQPIEQAGPTVDPFKLLGTAGAVAGDAPAGFVGGGWVGYLGFDLAHRLERLGASPPTRERLPAFALARYDHLLRLDADGRWWFEALVTPGRRATLERRLDVLAARLREGPPRGASAGARAATAPWTAEPNPVGHQLAVETCRERIAAGDLYQANLSLRLRSELSGDLAQLFARGVGELAPARAAYLRGSWGAVASLSPELYLERRDEAVRSAPIKGTRARGADARSDAAARDELATSAKDRAENVMIVDVARNDLGRVCRPGTVEVTALAEARPQAGVWHLESEVRGRLASDAGDAELLRASFPPASVTGAPKVAALDVIAELESAARQAFTGAIGFASPTAGLELNVAIRTFETDGRQLWLDVGGGIVADSDPADEAAEALSKAAPLLAAIGGELAEPSAARGGIRPRRRGARPLPRPDPLAGVFETLLWDGTELVALAQHLARISGSARALYGVEASLESLAETARFVAERAGAPCRVRLTLSADGRADGETGPLPDLSAAPELAPVTVPGGLGAHKWSDRRMLEALTAETAPAVALLVDLDGDVLEATWANVLIVDASGALVTPPLDGRILPGVTRARVLERARALGLVTAERAIHLSELESAGEVMVTSALRDVQPVGSGGAVAVALRRAARAGAGGL